MQDDNIAKICHEDETITHAGTRWYLANGRNAKQTRNSMREMARVLQCARELLGKKATLSDLLNLAMYSTLEEAILKISWDAKKEKD